MNNPTPPHDPTKSLRGIIDTLERHAEKVNAELHVCQGEAEAAAKHEAIMTKAVQMHSAHLAILTNTVNDLRAQLEQATGEKYISAGLQDDPNSYAAAEAPIFSVNRNYRP
jgi:hypothetical protein